MNPQKAVFAFCAIATFEGGCGYLAEGVAFAAAQVRNQIEVETHPAWARVVRLPDSFLQPWVAPHLV